MKVWRLVLEVSGSVKSKIEGVRYLAVPIVLHCSFCLYFGSGWRIWRGWRVWRL